MHENNKYVILTAVEASSIDFSKVKETSVDTLLWNNDNSKTFVKYEGDTQSALASMITSYMSATGEDVPDEMMDLWTEYTGG